MVQLQIAVFTHGTAVDSCLCTLDSCFHIWESIEQLSSFMGQLQTAVFTHQTAVFIDGIALYSCPHLWNTQLSSLIIEPLWTAVFVDEDGFGKLSWSVGQRQIAILMYGTALDSCTCVWNGLGQLFSNMGQPQTAVLKYGTASDSCPSVWDSLGQFSHDMEQPWTAFP